MLHRRSSLVGINLEDGIIPSKIPGPQREDRLLLPGIWARAEYLCIFINAEMLHIHMGKLWLLWELSCLSNVPLASPPTAAL